MTGAEVQHADAGALTKSQARAVLWRCVLAFFMVGSMAALPGALIPSLSLKFSLSAGQLATMLLVRSFAGVAAAIAGGFLMDRFGRPMILSAASVCVCVGMALVGAAQYVWMLWAGFCIAALGMGIYNNGANISMSEASRGNVRISNAMHVVSSLGMLTAPVLVLWGIRIGLGFRALPLMFSAVSLPLIFIMKKMPVAHADIARGNGGAKLFLRVARDPKFITFTALLFFIGCCEAGFLQWTPYYMSTKFNAPEAAAQLTLSAFGGAILAGRLLAALFGRRARPVPLLIGCGILVSVSITAAVFINNMAVSGVAIVLCGIAISCVYPTTVSMSRTTLRGSSSAGSVMMSVGSIGNMAMPYTVGHFADIIGIGLSMMWLMPFAGVLFLLSAVTNAYLHRKE